MIEEAYAMEANFRMSQGHFIGCKYNGLIYLFNKSEDCNEGRTLGIPWQCIQDPLPAEGVSLLPTGRAGEQQLEVTLSSLVENDRLRANETKGKYDFQVSIKFLSSKVNET